MRSGCSRSATTEFHVWISRMPICARPTSARSVSTTRYSPTFVFSWIFTRRTDLGRPVADVLLVEALPVRAVRAAHERGRPVREMRQDPVGDRLVVAREVELGRARAREEDAIGVGQPHAGHLRHGSVAAAASPFLIVRPPWRARAAGETASRARPAGAPTARSRTTSAAGLSSRRPWNDGWRIRPSAVHSLKRPRPPARAAPSAARRTPAGRAANGRRVLLERAQPLLEVAQALRR